MATPVHVAVADSRSARPFLNEQPVATEGLGIVAHLAAEGDRPSWGFLVLMRLIGGGSPFLGTAVRRQLTSADVSVIFLVLAAGSILYVVQLLGVAHKSGRKELLYCQ